MQTGGESINNTEGRFEELDLNSHLDNHMLRKIFCRLRDCEANRERWCFHALVFLYWLCGGVRAIKPCPAYEDEVR